MCNVTQPVRAAAQTDLAGSPIERGLASSQQLFTAFDPWGRCDSSCCFEAEPAPPRHFVPVPLIAGMTVGGDPAEAATGVVRLALLPDDGPHRRSLVMGRDPRALVTQSDHQ